MQTTKVDAAGYSVAMASSPRTASEKSTGATQKVAAKKWKAGYNHPSYQDMIKGAFLANPNERKLTRAAILKYIMQNYEVGKNEALVICFPQLFLSRFCS